METKKTININKNYFKVSPSNTSLKKPRERKEKPKLNKTKVNSMKKNIMERVRRHQESNKAIKENSSSDILEIKDDFSESLNYLKLVKDKIQKNKTLKRPKKRPVINNSVNVNINTPVTLEDTNKDKENTVSNIEKPVSNIEKPVSNIEKPVSNIEKPVSNIENIKFSNNNEETTINDVTNVLPIVKKDEPVYGCLKKGNKPTYKEWKKTTQKATFNDPLLQAKKNMSDYFNKPNNLRELKLQEFKNAYKEKNNKPSVQSFNRKPKTKTMKNKFIFGKNKNKISVYIKNDKTRKRVREDKEALKLTPIYDIKKYLKEHNLINQDSVAPDDVLVEMYENSKLSGDIENKDPKILIDNYLNKDNV